MCYQMLTSLTRCDLNASLLPFFFLVYHAVLTCKVFQCDWACFYFFSKPCNFFLQKNITIYCCPCYPDLAASSNIDFSFTCDSSHVSSQFSEISKSLLLHVLHDDSNAENLSRTTFGATPLKNYQERSDTTTGHYKSWNSQTTVYLSVFSRNPLYFYTYRYTLFFHKANRGALMNNIPSYCSASETGLLKLKRLS